MNKHKENNRARRICAKLRNTLHTLKTNEERIAAIQFNDELGAEEKAALVKQLQEASKLLQSRKNTLEKRQKELAYEDVDGIQSVPGFKPSHFAVETEQLAERGPARMVQISRRACKCTRAFFAVQDCFAAYAH